MDEKDLLRRAASYCAYQERSHAEVRQKLRSLGASVTLTEQLLTQLITDDFVNEERFARAFSRGKNSVRKWGRNRIRQELQQQGVSEANIRLGLSEIDENLYLSQFESLARTKWETQTEPDVFVRFKKCSNFLLYKGYEPDLVFSELKKLQASDTAK